MVKEREETGDVLNAAVIRLLRAMEAVSPETPRQFFALAALQIRRELIDLARKYRGPQGLERNVASQPSGFDPAAPADAASCSSLATPPSRKRGMRFRRVTPPDSR